MDTVQLLYFTLYVTLRYSFAIQVPAGSQYETYSIKFKPYNSTAADEDYITIGTFIVRALADKKMCTISGLSFGDGYIVPIDFNSDILPQLYQWTVDQLLVKDKYNNLAYVGELIQNSSQQVAMVDPIATASEPAEEGAKLD